MVGESIVRGFASLKTLCVNGLMQVKSIAVQSYPVGVVRKSGNGVTATAASDVVQSGRPVFDDFFQHLWPYIGNNTANGVFQMVKRLWLIHIDQ
ncbi:hypothetical protein TNCV_2552101 [Trichonephila clavipes]|nr:hypothetical protein TNCV_2552101 [Trichonephila clavipes]